MSERIPHISQPEDAALENSELLKELTALRDEKYDLAGTKEVINMHECMSDFAAELKNKFGMEILNQCVLYHFMIGSTPPGPLPIFDVEGGRIEGFIRNEL